MKPSVQKIITKLANQKVELTDPDKAIKNFKEESRKLVQAEKILRDAQSIAINVRKRLDDVLDELDASVSGYDKLLRGANKDFLDSSMIKELQRQEREVKMTRSQAGGRRNRARDITEAVAKVLNRR
jgi:hypothetical protein